MDCGFAEAEFFVDMLCSCVFEVGIKKNNVGSHAEQFFYEHAQYNSSNAFFLVIGFADFDSDFISMIFEYIETHFADSHIVVFYDESSSCFIAVVGNLFFNFRCACPKPVWKSGVGHNGSIVPPDG